VPSFDDGFFFILASIDLGVILSELLVLPFDFVYECFAIVSVMKFS